MFVDGICGLCLILAQELKQLYWIFTSSQNKIKQTLEGKKICDITGVFFLFKHYICYSILKSWYVDRASLCTGGNNFLITLCNALLTATCHLSLAAFCYLVQLSLQSNNWKTGKETRTM